MKYATCYADADVVEDILDNMNPNNLLFAGVDECFDGGAGVAQKLAIIKMCDLKKLIHKLKTIKGISND